jgi:hypothetical protein
VAGPVCPGRPPFVGRQGPFADRPGDELPGYFPRQQHGDTLVAMLFIGPSADESTDEHEGFVAGLDAAGRASDIWTDVRDRFAEYVAVIARCECGWTGVPQPADGAGHRAAEREWIDGHFAAVVGPGPWPDAMFLRSPARDVSAVT